MDSLSSLRVAELRLILAGAAIPAPARATKADLLARIRASNTALHHARDSHPHLFPPPSPSPPPPSDPEPLLAPPTVPEPLSPPTNIQLDPELEKRKKRAERFGIPLQELDPEFDKRRQRAERFGIPLVPYVRGVKGGRKRGAEEEEEEGVDREEQERRKRRAERFGLV